MKLEKVKRKIADGYSDGEIANMSGMSIEDIAKLRAPAPTPKKEAPAAVVTKKPVGEKKKK